MKYKAKSFSLGFIGGNSISEKLINAIINKNPEIDEWFFVGCLFSKDLANNRFIEKWYYENSTLLKLLVLCDKDRDIINKETTVSIRLKEHLKNLPSYSSIIIPDYTIINISALNDQFIVTYKDKEFLVKSSIEGYCLTSSIKSGQFVLEESKNKPWRLFFNESCRESVQAPEIF